ncbi:hypothetical protein AB4Y90_16560, partial [Chryseobacterium sp. 2TAF14]|uniref:hypothetical protein n=1 Tax=Chryseobacterium sp. 2TAF14 TaxID=3233007 RepID=UPI003F8DF459
MKKNLLLKFLFSVLVVLQTFCFAQNSREKPQTFTTKQIKDGISLEEEARFSENDNPAFASPVFDDAKWKHINFSSKKTYHKDQPYWIRYYFKIDSASVNESLCFNISQLGASEIYLNGKKIESIGKIGNAKT